VIFFSVLFTFVMSFIILRCIIPIVFKYAKERRILLSHNTTVYMC